MLTFEALRAFSDNYIWLLLQPETRRLAVVDPGDADPVQRWLAAHPDWQVSDILVTHHHRDHTGGVAALAEATGARVAGPRHESIPGRSLALCEGDHLEVLGHRVQVLDAPGHTLGHILYYHPDPVQPWLLSGDTLFAGGCGRLFEGSPQQMHASLGRLGSLPGHTLIYCAHEYTESNLRFAQAVEPGNPAIAQRLAAVRALRAEDRMTLPSRLDEELATNPFLRVEVSEVRQAACRQGASEDASGTQVFACLRRWKDNFR